MLSALGIAIGIASLVGVLGLSESSKSDLLAELDALGTNLLTVQAGTGFGIGNAELPETTVGMVGRIGTVLQVSAVSSTDASVLRTDFIPSGQTGGVSVVAAESDLLDTLGGSVASGTFLDGAALEYPAAVLGSVAAERLGIRSVENGVAVWLGETWVEVIGVLDPFPLAADLDRAVIVGTEAAERFLDQDLVPGTVYLRVNPDFITETRDIIPRTVDPENPEEVEVSRPSDVLVAQAAAEDAFSSLFLGLGAVALFVGGIGIANIMVISVIERRSEIGLRRAIGATRGHIMRQFLTESLLLGLLGGIAGVFLGSVVTAGYAALQGWAIIIPTVAVIGGLAAAVAIGAVAGLYPAMRAARLSPTEALRAE
ncbi:MAG: ABC transporter permease [Acidimicrobiia bacterium]|nr:ABC transporter permease [Acidimicrobiia bacterium]